MSYNNMSYQSYITTAGKITVITTLLGVVVFAIVFLLNLGAKEFQQATAQSRATTTVNVLNTPPDWTAGLEGRETPESSTSSPTNSGDDVTWIGTAVDANGADYYMLICSGTSTPTEPTATSTGAPSCANGQIQWAVSGATNSGTQATAATTTIDRVTPSNFAESNVWFAWVCDADPVNPRCNSTYSTGTAATNSSPFHVNSRPSFTDLYNDSPTDPGSGALFTSTSSDADTVGPNDTVQLWICAAQDFSTTTNECGVGGTLASTTFFATANATATFNIPVPYQDQDYAAYGYIVDNHGHEASGVFQGSNATVTVNNVAPTVAGATISLNGGTDMILTEAASQTPNFTLSYVVTDNNSCENFAAGDEIVDYAVSVYRSGIGSTTCDALTGTQDENNCYVSEDTTAVWNLSCAATTTPSDCTGDDDATQTWECTFPLWYIADPTDNFATATPYSAENWLAEVAAIDDDAATGTPQESTSGPDLLGLLAFALDTLEIPYGAIEPGSDTGTLSASTTIRATGNVGLDEELEGTSMCPSYTSSTPCSASATSTIPESEQQFATGTFAYNDARNTALSSTTIQELELNVPKSTATSTQEQRDTYWGIAIPGTITLAGDYFGQNTFYAKISEPADWQNRHKYN